MKKSLTIRLFALTAFIATPLLTFAQSQPQIAKGINSFSELIDLFTKTIVKTASTLLLSLALIAFFVGIVQYIWGSREGDATKISKGNEFMKWSLVALFVMFSVYGIIRFGQGFLCGGACDNTIVIPDINFKTGATTNGAANNAGGGLQVGGAANNGGGGGNGGGIFTTPPATGGNGGATNGGGGCDPGYTVTAVGTCVAPGNQGDPAPSDLGDMPQ
jgi:hypothetical protein